MSDDPINPKHYSGTACAEIGERLSANSYQVLKYNWRLGKKDAATIEVGKSIWYLDREIELSLFGFRPNVDLPPDDWFERRLAGQDTHVEAVARLLINWNRYSDQECLNVLRGVLDTLLTTLKENN